MIVRRNRMLHLRKRVPKRFRSIEPRPAIYVSLHTDSLMIAEAKAPAVWAELIEAWESRLAGDTADAEKRWAAALELADKRGFRFLTARAVSALPLGELLDRVEAVERRDGQADAIEARALLGGAQPPELTLSRALELYWSLAADRAIGKTHDQLRRWKNPRIRAFRNLIGVVGDKPLSRLTADDTLEFRDWLVGRVKRGEISPASANKDLTYITDTLRTANKLKRLGLDLPLSGLALKQAESGTRPPFSEGWIKTKLLAPGALGGLNIEARCILLAMINTGARPSEIAGLSPKHIHLDVPTPFIEITDEARQLKTRSSKRNIPLVGTSHAAMKQCPNGFPTYAGKDLISATVNKYLREHGLLETPKHTLYSLRHAFEDRALAAGIDERIRRDLMGHALDRERYGAGASLEHKAKLLETIAF